MGTSQRASLMGQVHSTESITGIDNVTAVGLTVPERMAFCMVTVSGAAARWRSDGTDPTPTVGHPLGVDSALELYNDELKYFKIIATTATPANIFVSYYKRA